MSGTTANPTNEVQYATNLAVKSLKNHGTQTQYGAVTYYRGHSHAYQKTQTKSADYTMTAADSGYVTKIDTDAKTITLPATVVGYTYIFENAGSADGAIGITISPNASDKIIGAGLTAADNKDLINTKATARVGDYVVLFGDGVDGWYIQEMRGTWAREA